jgi:hypothetical protein
MKHAKVSESNPALVICVVDCSDSMDGSNAHRHAFAAITSLRRHASGKHRQVRLVVFGFADGIIFTQSNRGYDGWCEDVVQIRLAGGRQTHLKMACDEAVKLYRNHVSQRCEDDDPLTNILLFTDGEHTPGLDRDYPDWAGGQGMDNEWARPRKTNGWIEPIAELENVLLGVIDYSGDLPEFPLPGTEMNRRKVTCASVLDKSLLEKAYARDRTVPPPPGQSLREVFGPMEDLEGKLFIVSSQTIRQNPQVTSAFVRLGTASTFASTFAGVGAGDGGGGPPVDDGTDFTAIRFGDEEG